MYHIEKQLVRCQQGVVDDFARVLWENAKRKEGKEREVASIKEAYYRNKLRMYHNIRRNRSTFKIRDFVLLSLSSTDGQQVWQGPHMVSGVYEGDLYKITDSSDHSLVQTAKGTSV
ncbi:hypothetical protein Tco_0386584, partial [Tanacetum coccineum]